MTERIQPHLTLVPARTQQAAEPSDAQLIALAGDGDRRAQERLFRRHAGVLTRIATRLLRGDQSEGEDVALEALAIGFARLGDVREHQAFRAFLVRITVRLARRRAYRQRWLSFVPWLGGDAEPAGLLGLASPGLPAEVRAELALLDRVLSTLDVDARFAWTMRHVEGMELSEVAAACNCSLSTAKRRIAAAEAAVTKVVSFEGVSRVRPRGGAHD